MFRSTPQLKTSFKSVRHFSKLNRIPTTSLLKTNPLLVPQLTFSSQLKVDLLKCFNSSQIAHYYRPPKSFVGSGTIGRIWSRIPDTIKILGFVGATASLVIFVALPMFIIVVPPIIIGTWLLTRVNRYSKNKRLERVWSSIADSTLVYKPQPNKNPLLVLSPEIVHNHIAQFEMNRILDAFWSNEDGIADYFKVEDMDNLALGTLEAIEYNYNSTSVIFADDYSMLVTQQRPLYDKTTNKEIATVILNMKCLDKPLYEGMVDPSANIGKSIVQIEIVPNSLMAQPFVLKTSSVSTSDINDDGNDGDFYDDDGFINVKGKTRNL